MMCVDDVLVGPRGRRELQREQRVLFSEGVDGRTGTRSFSASICQKRDSVADPTLLNIPPGEQSK